VAPREFGAGHSSAEELPSVATHGEALRATGKDSKPPHGLIIPGTPDFAPLAVRVKATPPKRNVRFGS